MCCTAKQTNHFTFHHQPTNTPKSPPSPQKQQLTGYQKNELVLLEVRINSEPADPLSVIVHRDAAFRVGKALCLKLKELIPRQMFKVPIQVRVMGFVRCSRCVGVPQGGEWMTKRWRKAGAEQPPTHPKNCVLLSGLHRRQDHRQRGDRALPKGRAGKVLVSSLFRAVCIVAVFTWSRLLVLRSVLCISSPRASPSEPLPPNHPSSPFLTHPPHSGGDISRKKKLLNKQAEGKKRMKAIGKVEVPQSAFMAVLNINREED